MGLARAYRVTRDVSADEGDNYADRDVTKGEIVYDILKPTYGAAAYPNFAVTFDEDGDYPFFEFPCDALEPVMLPDGPDGP